MIPGVLVLEDGLEFSGFLFGASVTAEKIRQNSQLQDYAYGEVVFNTSMTGYQEILTDPSYYGQMICMTAPHIGNTGINFEDLESQQIWCSGFIAYEVCEQPLHWRSQGGLGEYLSSKHIPGICGVNTRALTRYLRTVGVTRGVILPQHERAEASSLLQELPSFEGRDLIHEVSTQKPYFWNGSQTVPSDAYTVVAVDFGIKWNLLRHLAQLGCTVEVVPASTSAQDILARKPNGVFLSNGPGDPTAVQYAVRTVQKLLGKVPIFGVCMGHQILALALGAQIYKLKFGHRGGNQPVLDQQTGRVEISSHNHGYSVDLKTLPREIEVTHLNLNDKTIEGIAVQKLNAFSVQYHPEAGPGPHDSLMLFKRFMQNMKDNVSKIS